ncbi:MAG: Mov34/MPN/PAD-1 family protein [Candidatus Helarchaeota archaeon]
MKVIIYYEVYNTIFEHSSSNLNHEICGFLFGIPKNGVVLVKRAYKGEKVGSSVHVDLNHIEMLKAIEFMNEKYPTLKLIGWYHSHPGMGAHFFSQIDVQTQLKYQYFFSQAIGIVIDPKRIQDQMKLIDCDFKVWRIENDNAIKIRFFLEKSFKNKKDKHRMHLKRLSTKNVEMLREFERRIQKEINDKVEIVFTNSKYHINFQQNNRKIWLRFFTTNYKKFEKFDLLVSGRFNLKKFQRDFQLQKKNEMDLKIFQDRKKDILIFRFKKDVNLTKYLEIFKKLNIF